ncbi:MAG TPA: ZIP family metal transporter [Chloroflexota bacterium]|nr:ZIP family metal transporter [Chloroflexota bacterium]
MLAVFSILPFFSTLFGGVVALRLRHRLHPIMAFAGGVLVATALADLLPEGIELVSHEGGAGVVGVAAVVGYLAFSALEALVHRQSWEHQHPAYEDPDTPHQHPGEPSFADSSIGVLGPLGLVVHSTLDGLAIGLGFHASFEVGLIVALAVLAHDFADGMNVVTLALAGGHGQRAAIVVLALDALAPPFGVLLSNVLVLSSAALGTLLGVFAGVFIAIGASHLLPEAQHQRPGAAPALWTLAVLGAIVPVAVRVMIGS